MTDRYYKAFISSTTVDLNSQRIDVFRSLIDNSCIPVSMESFPVGEKTIAFIKENIRACDFVVLILDHHYGSRVDPPDSRSYTQLEYEYAIENNIPVLPLVRIDPQNDSGQSEEDWRSFLEFRQQVRGAGHIVGMWSHNPPGDNHRLTYHLANGLKVISDRLKSNPDTGWLRASEVPPQFRTIIESCRQLGIDQILSDGNQRQEEMDNRLAGSRQSVKVFATTAEPLIRNRGQMLTEALANGAQLQILVAERKGQFISDVEEIEAYRDGQERKLDAELEQIRGFLRGYLTSARDRCIREGRKLRSVVLGSFTTQFRVTLVLCDQDWGKVTLTIPPHRATTTASFEVKPQAIKDPLLRQLHEHFDHNWRIAEKHGRIEELGPRER